MFSLGVVICELVTGVLSRIETQHQMTYIVNGRNLEEDADMCVDWDDGLCLKKMSSLALKCMAYSASSRPLIGDIVKELQDIVNGTYDVQSEEQLLERSLDSSSSPATQCNSVEKYLIGVSHAEVVPANIPIVTIASKVHSCAI